MTTAVTTTLVITYCALKKKSDKGLQYSDKIHEKQRNTISTELPPLLDN
jgi:hypothetical protein